MTPTSHPLVSVVTPVYNGERFLRECIESVLAQTYTHWDYTFVDNCSTDRTPEIIREYASKDPRIRVVRNPATVRVIENHNIAFRQVSPESRYCKVIAADDQLYPECLEKMVALAEANPTVGIVGAYSVRGTDVIWNGLPFQCTVIRGPELCRRYLLKGPYVFGTPTSVLYRSDLVLSRHAFYNESNLHSDTEICLEFLEKADFGFIHQVLTVQGVQDDSLTSYSTRFGTHFVLRLSALVHYGHTYLNEEELKVRIREHLTSYYAYLSRQVFRGREREFWHFHRRKLAEVGWPLSTVRLSLSVIAIVMEVVLNPKRTAEGVVRRMRRLGRG